MTTLDIDSAIRSRAYQYWKAEGELPGRELDYWLKAEAEVRAVTVPVTKAAQTRAKSAPPSPAKSSTKSPARKPATRAKAKA